MLKLETIRDNQNFRQLESISFTYDINFDNNQNYSDNKAALRNLLLSHYNHLIRTVCYTPNDLQLNPANYLYIEDVISDDINEEDGILVNTDQIRILDIEYYHYDNSFESYLKENKKTAYFKRNTQLIKIDDLTLYSQINHSLEILKATFSHRLTFTKYFVIYSNINKENNFKMYENQMGDYLYHLLNKNHLYNNLQQVTKLDIIFKSLSKLNIILK